MTGHRIAIKVIDPHSNGKDSTASSSSACAFFTHISIDPIRNVIRDGACSAMPCHTVVQEG